MYRHVEKLFAKNAVVSINYLYCALCIQHQLFDLWFKSCLNNITGLCTSIAIILHVALLGLVGWSLGWWSQNSIKLGYNKVLGTRRFPSLYL